jgi:hypothetical protein
MQAKLIITFEPMSDSGLLTLSGGVVEALTDNPHFPEPWAPPTPGLATVRGGVEALRSAYYAALSRDTFKIAERNQRRVELERMLRQVVAYLELTANGDVAKLATTGFELRRDAGRGRASSASAAVPPAPSDLRLSMTGARGVVELNAINLPGVIGYEIQISTGDPTAEASWIFCKLAPTLRRVLIDGLPSGPFWVRVRAISRNGNGAWTTPVSVLVD